MTWLITGELGSPKMLFRSSALLHRSNTSINFSNFDTPLLCSMVLPRTGWSKIVFLKLIFMYLSQNFVSDSEISIWSDFKVCYNIIEIEIESSVRNCKKAEMAIWPFQVKESHDFHVSSQKQHWTSDVEPILSMIIWSSRVLHLQQHTLRYDRRDVDIKLSRDSNVSLW